MHKILLGICFLNLGMAEDANRSASQQTKTSSCVHQEQKCEAKIDLLKKRQPFKQEGQTRRPTLPTPQLPASQSRE